MLRLAVLTATLTGCVISTDDPDETKEELPPEIPDCAEEIWRARCDEAPGVDCDGLECQNADTFTALCVSAQPLCCDFAACWPTYVDCMRECSDARAIEDHGRCNDEYDACIDAVDGAS